MEKQSRPLFALSSDEFLELLGSHNQKIDVAPALPPDPQDELLTLKEVCRFFKKTRQTIRNWTKQKYIRVIVVGGSNFYSKNEIEKYLNKKLKGFSFSLKDKEVKHG